MSNGAIQNEAVLLKYTVNPSKQEDFWIPIVA